MPHFLILIAAAFLLGLHGLAADVPVYDNKADLLFYLDSNGGKHAVRSPADWARRVAHTKGNMQKVMGPLPEPSSEPLDIRVVEEIKTAKCSRRRITFVSE